MNRENVEKVRDRLLQYSATQEKPQIPGDGKLAFCMAWHYNENSSIPLPLLFNDCGAAGCLIAWTNILCGPPLETEESSEDERHKHWGSSKNAAKLLGVTKLQAENLFYPDTDVGLYGLTAINAAYALTRLLETGDVEWDASLGYRAKKFYNEEI